MVESKFKPDMQIADEGHDEDLAEKRLKFSAEDVKYLAYSHLALRYVSGKTNLDAHSEGPVKGDAHPICAMHLLLTAEEKEGSRKPAHGYIDMVEKYADRIAQRLDTKLDEILSWAHVEPEGKVKPESYFLLVSGMRGLENPYDLHAYPMGKAGKQEIRKNQVVSVVEANVNYGVDGIADDIKRAIRTENVNGILNALYPEAQSIMDKNVSAEYLQEDVERFSKNIDVLCQVDPATAYRYAAALLISADASPLHDTAERVAVASLSALAKNDPDSAKISADIAVELGPRSNLQTRLANAVRHLSSAESPDTGRREWSSMSAPEQFMVLAKIQVDDFLEGKVSEDGIPKAVRNLGETLETYAKSAPKEVAGFCADMLLNPDLDRFSEVAGKAYGGAMKALQSVDVGAAISTAKEHLDNYGGIAAIATVATVVAASVATKSAPVSLVRNVAKNGMSA